MADAERIRHVAGQVAGRVGAGDEVVVVVSAMGNRTDELIDLALEVSPDPDPRELDQLLATGEHMSAALLAMALHAMDQEAVGLTGSQAGIYSRASHGSGRIQRIDADRIEDELRAGRIPIVAGFQGVTEEADYVTLGRGASDLTAVALGVALGADRCETYKDVEGVYTADPRIVPSARRLADVHYEEMLEMATQGSQVMHNRAVELAAVNELPILVASSMVDAPGTLIHGGPEMEERNRVRGVVDDHDIAKVTLRHVPDRRGIAAQIFEPLAALASSAFPFSSASLAVFSQRAPGLLQALAQASASMLVSSARAPSASAGSMRWKGLRLPTRLRMRSLISSSVAASAMMVGPPCCSGRLRISRIRNTQ